MKIFTSVLSSLICLAAAAHAVDSPADVLAGTLLERSGVKAGVCEFPRVGDGVLADAIARAGVAHVHGLAPDAKSAELARKPAELGKVLGSRVTIETGSPSAIPLGDWVADLLVVADASDENLKDLSPAEICRVLAPYRGVAIVGQPSGRKETLSKTTLETWAKQLDSNARVSEDASGLWAVIRMQPLAGGDDWSHHTHGANGNLVSDDKVFATAPFELQWTDRPYFGGHWDIHVVSAGRMFTAQSSVFQHPNLPYELVARNAFNGVVLWRRPIAQDFGEASSLLIATPERLYIKDTNGVLALDPETGKELQRVAASSDETQPCLLLLHSDHVLLALTGPTQRYGGEAQDYTQSPAKQKAQDETNALYEGRELVAWDASDGKELKELWRFSEEQIDPSKIAVNNGRVFLYAKRTYAACLDLKTGTQIWKTEAPMTEPKGPGMGFVSGHATVKTLSMFRNGAMATNDVYFINYLPHRHCAAFAAGDGHPLWDKMHGPPTNDAKQTDNVVFARMFCTPVVLGKTIFERENWQKPGETTDLLTGNSIKDPTKFSYGGCGRFTATSEGLLIGQCGEVYDTRTHKPLINYNAESTCGTGQFVANGMLFKVGSSCGGCTEWRGFFASRSVPKHELRTGIRLEPGAAAQPAEITGDPSDWTTYRGDATRKASSAATVSDKGAIRWVFSPVRPAQSILGPGGHYLEPDLNSAQPIAVGQRIFIGTADGAVVCLDQKTGAETWRYWTAGRIMSSPTWYQGKLYAGSCDGWVYCLNAATGGLLWRYRITPEERRVMILGHLSSAWPIMANVLVQDGTVFAVGGLVGQLGGSILCAIDAQSGAPRWEKRFEGISSSGQLAWYQNMLWWHAGDLGLFVIDPANGEAKQAIDFARVNDDTRKRQWGTWSAARGQDIGILPGGWVVSGGHQFNLPPDLRVQPGVTCSFLNAEAGGATLDENKAPKLFVLKDHHMTDSLPAWDSREVLLAGGQGLLVPTLCTDLGKALSAIPAHAGGIWESGLNMPVKLELPPDQIHSALPAGTRNACLDPILGGNAIVFMTGDWENMYVMAANRTTHAILWVVHLPGCPAWGSSLSLTHNGDVLVPLVDGRVVCIGAPPLIEALRDDCAIEIKSQQELDKPATALAPALVKLLNHPNEVVVLHAAETLQKVDLAGAPDDLLRPTLNAPETLDTLAKGFKNSHPTVRSVCLDLVDIAAQSAKNETAIQKFVPLLSQLLEHENNQAVRSKAFAVLAAIDPQNEALARNLNVLCTTSKTGAIPQWLALGPIPIPPADAQGRGLDVEQIPGQASLAPTSGEKITIGNRSFKWKLVTGDDNGIINGAAALGAAENVAMYMITYINAERELTGLRLSWGSDDSAAVYLNGKEVSRYVGGRAYAPDQNVAENVTLKAGTNTIMMKILNTSGGYGGCMRILDAENKPCAGLHIIPVPLKTTTLSSKP